MLRKLLLFSVLFLYFIHLFSQKQEKEFATLLLYQDTLVSLQQKMFKGKNDGEKYRANRIFLNILQRALNTKNSFEFGFDSLTSIARLVSPDKLFKIYNWNIPKEDGTHEYFGFIQAFTKKAKMYVVYPLIDKSGDVINPENYISDNNKWYGMLYYKILEKKYKKKTSYILLGWDGNDKLTSKKIIDVLSFSDDGSPRFGDGIFEMGKRLPKRVVFEYSAQIVMSLKYDEQRRLIVFDHLAPPSNGLEGQHQFYGPDMSYDGFIFKKGKWIYVEDVDARNSNNSKDKLYNDPKANKIEEIKK